MSLLRYNGTCVFLVDASRVSNTEAEAMANLLSELMSLEINPKRDDEQRLYHILLVELGAHKKDTPQYTGPDSVAWVSVCGETDLKDHALTRAALPELAPLYAQAQSLEPDPEALEAAAAKPLGARDPAREAIMQNLLTHEFVEGRRLDNASFSSESTTAYEQKCKHCGFTFPPCYSVPICTAARP